MRLRLTPARRAELIEHFTEEFGDSDAYAQRTLLALHRIADVFDVPDSERDDSEYDYEDLEMRMHDGLAPESDDWAIVLLTDEYGAGHCTLEVVQ